MECGTSPIRRVFSEDQAGSQHKFLQNPGSRQRNSQNTSAAVQVRSSKLRPQKMRASLRYLGAMVACSALGKPANNGKCFVKQNQFVISFLTIFFSKKGGLRSIM
jgi:hypothetical protein